MRVSAAAPMLANFHVKQGLHNCLVKRHKRQLDRIQPEIPPRRLSSTVTMCTLHEANASVTKRHAGLSILPQPHQSLGSNSRRQNSTDRSAQASLTPLFRAFKTQGRKSASRGATFPSGSGATTTTPALCSGSQSASMTTIQWPTTSLRRP